MASSAAATGGGIAMDGISNDTALNREREDTVLTEETTTKGTGAWASGGKLNTSARNRTGSSRARSYDERGGLGKSPSVGIRGSSRKFFGSLASGSTASSSDGPRSASGSTTALQVQSSSSKPSNDAPPVPLSSENINRMVVDFVQRFVPDMVIERISSAGAVKGEELSRHFAVTGFFDVAGFSSLARKLEETNKASTERIQRKRRSMKNQFDSHSGKGAEQLVAQLNETLASLISTIRLAGGDIIKFAGDAILVVWMCDEKELPMNALRATKCAVDCCNIKQANSSLGLHVGIGCGELIAAHVGGTFGRYEFFIAGDSCSQCSQAEGDAGLDEVVISGSTFDTLQTLGEDCKISAVEIVPKENNDHHHDAGPNRKPNFLVKDVKAIGQLGLRLHQPPQKSKERLEDPAAVKAAEGYIPGPVRESLKSGGTRSVDGLRKLSVIFFKLYDVALPTVFDEESSKAFLAQTQKQAKLVQESAYHYYGTLRQFILDDKGFVAIVVLGLPPYFFEDNASRAVKVATRLIHINKVRAAAGVCSGTVFCGVIGSTLRAEYSVVGSCVNLAARFMGKAGPNNVLCDTVTRNEAENSGLTFIQMPALTVKGFDLPVDCFKPVMKNDGRSRGAVGDAAEKRKLRISRKFSTATAMADTMETIGRRWERDAIGRSIFIDHTPASAAKAIFVQGDPGIGKSHLAEWAVNTSPAEHIFVCTCDASELNTQFFSWRSIILDILSVEEEAPKRVDAFTSSGSLRGRGRAGTAVSMPSTSQVTMPDFRRSALRNEIKPVQNGTSASDRNLVSFAPKQQHFDNDGILSQEDLNTVLEEKTKLQFLKTNKLDSLDGSVAFGRKRSLSSSEAGNLKPNGDDEVGFHRRQRSTDSGVQNKRTHIADLFNGNGHDKSKNDGTQFDSPSKVQLLADDALETKQQAITEAVLGNGTETKGRTSSMDFSSIAGIATVHDDVGASPVSVISTLNDANIEPRLSSDKMGDLIGSVKVRKGSETSRDSTDKPIGRVDSSNRSSIGKDGQAEAQPSLRAPGIMHLAATMANATLRRLNSSNDFQNKTKADQDTIPVQQSPSLRGKSKPDQEVSSTPQGSPVRPSLARKGTVVSRVISSAVASLTSISSPSSGSSPSPTPFHGLTEVNIPAPAGGGVGGGSSSSMRRSSAGALTDPLKRTVRTSNSKRPIVDVVDEIHLPEKSAVLNSLKTKGKLSQQRLAAMKVILPFVVIPSTTSAATASSATQITDKEAAMDVALAILEECEILFSTLIVFENAQHLDVASWELLHRALSRDTDPSKSPRVRYLITMRPHHFPKEHPIHQIQNMWIDVNEDTAQEPLDLDTPFDPQSATAVTDATVSDEKRQSASILHLTLGPLSRRESGMFLSHETNVVIGENLLDFLYGKSNGNPRALLDGFKALKDRGVIEVDEETGMLKVTANLSEIGDMSFMLSDDVRAKLLQKFDKLPSHIQLILKLASAAGKTTDFTLLVYLFEKFNNTTVTLENASSVTINGGSVSMAIVKEGLAKILENEFMHSMPKYMFSNASEAPWVFKSDHVRFLIYNEMLYQDRFNIHSAILRFYEEHPEFTEDPTLMGFHATSCEEYDNAFRFFELGIRKALAASAIESALDCWDQCNDILENKELHDKPGFSEQERRLKRSIVSILLAQCYISEQHWEEACEYLRVAMEVTGSSPQSGTCCFSKVECWGGFFSCYSVPPSWEHNDLFLMRIQNPKKQAARGKSQQDYDIERHLKFSGKVAAVLYRHIQEMLVAHQRGVKKVTDLSKKLST